LEFWCAFHEIEPFGPRQEELRAGVLAALVHNRSGLGTKKARLPANFFPSLKPAQKAKPFNWKAHQAEMRSLAESWNNRKGR
jgi:hypothetical protein